jgi:hypothetical protein
MLDRRASQPPARRPPTAHMPPQPSSYYGGYLL